MSGNNSTVNISPNITTTNCGVGVNCNDSQECFAAQEGPICDDNNKNTTYSWKLNTIVFPPIEYVGHNVGRKSKDHCEMFTFIELPSGSFIRPLDYIGSCSNIVETSSGISLQQLYCDYDSKCRKRINSLKSYCFSSNQCLSQLCGSYNITQPIDGNITFTVGSLCVNDGFLAYDHLRGYRAFNVKPVDDVSNDNSNNNNNNNNNNQDDNNKDSSGSMAVIIIILVILFTSMAIYGYARRLFKKRDNNDDDTHYLRREIDPETGQVITVNTLGGRVRRGASLILNRNGGLNRTNSIRTLPPYTVMDEERPQSTSSNGGIVNSITQFFFPPGELPPPYVAVAENGSANYNNDVTLEEVREGVTIGGNNNNNNSIPTSRRTSLRSTTDDDTSRRDDDHDGDLGESSIISEVRPKEVTVDNSEGDKTEIGGSEVGGSRVGGIEDEKEEIEKEESEKEAAEKEESEKEAAVEKEESEKEVEKEEIEKEESEKGEIEKGESEKGESEKGESEKEESEKEKIDKSEVDKVEGEENVYYNSNT